MRPIPCRLGSALLATLLLAPADARTAQSPEVTLSPSHPLQWHALTLDLQGPFARETDPAPNPFLDYRLTVTFTHQDSRARTTVPGYFAADGSAADSSATEGRTWRTRFAPGQTGTWSYEVAFVQGTRVAVTAAPGQPVEPLHGVRGSFQVAPTDKSGRDFHAHGRLQYVGRHHLRFAGSGEYFLKAGADSPETLLAFADFDGTRAHAAAGTPARPGEAAPAGLKSWSAHVGDWREGDPTWRDGRGKGLIGALNYLAGKGGNAISFLPYNAGGDGDNVWPFVDRDDKLHFDCSKLDQWGRVFDHATTLGLFLHFKLQETEIDDQRLGPERKPARVPTSLDGGALGTERKLYLRELVARFGHALALNWNLGEENTQSPEEQRAMAACIQELDPYDHPIVIHTYPHEQDRVYTPLLGDGSVLAGASLQNAWHATHARTLHWITASARAGRPWVVCNDEQGDASLGVPPDPGYQGFGGKARESNGREYALHHIRQQTLWGNLMAGGAGVEYYFGYTLPQNDLGCEDWRSRDRSWDYARIALGFFREHRVPFWEMEAADGLLRGSPGAGHVLARPGQVYVIYLPNGGSAELDLQQADGAFRVAWFDPRSGGGLLDGPVTTVNGGARAGLGTPPANPGDDWVILVRR